MATEDRPLETRALLALYRNHPDTPPADRWGWRAKARARQSRTELLAWAATKSDEELLWCRNLGATSLAWIRAHQGAATPAAPNREKLAAAIFRAVVASKEDEDHPDFAYSIADQLIAEGAAIPAAPEALREYADEQAEVWLQLERNIWPRGPASGSGSGFYATFKGRLVAKLRAALDLCGETSA